MSTKAVPLGLRLFLEGIEVPVISAQVTIQPDRPAVSAIQIIPSDMALHLLPRTLVHLFYLDDDAPPPTDRTVRVSDGITETEQARFDAPDSAYKLLFSGEVIGYNFGKNPSSRSLVIQCMDLSSYWDTCYQWFADYSVGGNGLTDKSHNFVGAGKSMFNSVAGGHQWVIGRILNTKPKSSKYQNTKGLLSGIIHLLEAIGGVRYSNGDPGFNGVNDFFTIAELRYNLMGMLGAVASDETSSKIYNSKAFRSWLRNGMTSLGTLMSFRDILNHVCKHIYHHTYPNPCAYYVPESSEKNTFKVDSSLYTDVPSGKVARDFIRKALIQAANAQNFFAAALAESAGHIAAGVTAEFESGRLALKGAIDHTAEATTLLENTNTDDKSDVLAKLSDIKSDLRNAQLEVKDRPQPLDFFSKIEKAQKLSSSAADGLEWLTGPSQRAKNTKSKSVTLTSGSHLYTQLLLPETFFVAPPRCNVFFPDRYTQFSFSRNFMREVSRLSSRGGLGMVAGGRRGAALLGRTYFAPNIKDARGKNLYATMGAGARILLPHEIHSGIIPKFEWVTDGHRWAWKGSKETGKRDEFHKAGKVGYLQRLVNFQFYIHRWSSRTMSLNGVFNPNVVLGFPALVMDRSMPAPAVQKRIEMAIGRRWMPVQYLGKVAYIAHSVGQSGGQTQVNFTHCRTHRGLDDEFLGALVKEVDSTKGVQYSRKFKVSRLIAKDPHEEDAALVEEFIGLPVPSVYKDRDDFKKLVQAYMQGKLVEGQLVPRTIKAFRGSKVRRIKTSGDILQIDAATAWKELGINPTTTVTVTRTETLASGEGGEYAQVEVAEGAEILEIYDNFDITFEKQVPAGEILRTKRSVEEALTPGWYSDIWTNKKITENVYAPLLGVESVGSQSENMTYTGALAVVDQLSLSSEEQDDILNRSFEDEFKFHTYETSEGGSSTETTTPTTSLDEITKMEVIPGSIEEAVDSLSFIYSMLKTRGGDVHEFIKQYTKRPIATIEQVLGSHNLSFDDNGNIDPSIEEEVIEGFHSRAFGDYNTDVKLPDREGAKPEPGKDALKALFPGQANPASVARKNIFNHGNPPSAILPELDPRGRARARVRLYIQELTVSRGLLG